MNESRDYTCIHDLNYDKYCLAAFSDDGENFDLKLYFVPTKSELFSFKFKRGYGQRPNHLTQLVSMLKTNGAELEKSDIIKFLRDLNDKLKEMQKEGVKQNLSDITPIFEDVKLLTSGIDFIKASPLKCYVTYLQPALVKYKEGSLEKQERRFLPFVVTNEREIFEYNRDKIFEMGFVWSDPVFIENKVPRWHPKDILAYKNAENSNLNSKEVFEQCRNVWVTYMDLLKQDGTQDRGAYTYLTLYLMGSYFFKLFESYPYLFLSSQKGSGKTRILEIFKHTGFNSFLGADYSAASIYNLVDSCASMLLLDESEYFHGGQVSDKFKEIIPLLNSGYKSSGSVYRMFKKTEKDRQYAKEYKTYSPKVFAGINMIQDTLRDRGHEIVLRKSTNKEKQRPLQKEDSTYWFSIRNNLYLFLLENFRKIDELNADFEVWAKDLEFMNRELEIARPILVIAKYIGEDVYNDVLEWIKEQINQKNLDMIENANEVVLIEILYKNIPFEKYYLLKDITDWVKANTDMQFVKNRTISSWLKRLGFTNKRRVGRGYEYLLTPAQIELAAQRNGVLDILRSGGSVIEDLNLDKNKEVTVEDILPKQNKSLSEFEKEQDAETKDAIESKRLNLEGDVFKI